MNILKDPAKMAAELVDCCHMKDATSYFIIFGRWCEQNQRLPEGYIKEVAQHIAAASGL